MTLHHYRDSIDYRDKIIVNYQDIGFTIIAQPYIEYCYNILM